MDPAIHQSLGFLSLLVIGLFLKAKIRDKRELRGIKTVILSVALPATIFVALLKIELTSSLIILPILGLVANVILYLLGTLLIVPLFAKTESEDRKRTYRLLIASFAPGLSCFPFIIEYLGDQALASAALVDVGNKIFVLIILYLIAMKWYQDRKSKSSDDKVDIAGRVKSLLISLVKEPVNGVMIVALILLMFGMNLVSLPLFIQQFVTKAHVLTTGLVLIFIGAAFNIQKAEAQSIFSVLLLRSGIAFFVSTIALLLVGNSMLPALALLLVIFPQSSCSFWPLAHMSAVDELEQKESLDKTFNIQSGLNVLACSLPFSSMLILGICTTGEFFVAPLPNLVLGAVMTLGGIALRYLPQPLGVFLHDYREEVLQIRSEKTKHRHQVHHYH